LSQILVDASIALSWCFENECTPATNAALKHLQEYDSIVPQYFWLELANAILQSEKSGRVTGDEAAEFIALIADLQIELDENQELCAFTEIRARAHQQDLTAYDALYLDLALRRRLPLATLDTALIRAAGCTGVYLFTPSA
jgi:predicted nucleic acid-binding protein